ncbi:MAG: type II toxin-antitoxin system RelE/ParE family toxin [Acidobacteria bacterium]|nr:MAG: type II toxin-antitoxin system RelE/ParE family toxin [Acidobacteriota bacterium]
MSYQVEIARPAQIEIKALPGHVRAQARQLINSLKEIPRPTRAKQLRDKPNIYRLWLVRRWRIAYLIDDDLKLVRVLRIRRKEIIDYETL